MFIITGQPSRSATILKLFSGQVQLQEYVKLEDSIYEVDPKEENCFRFSRLLNFKVSWCMFSVEVGTLVITQTSLYFQRWRKKRQFSHLWFLSTRVQCRKLILTTLLLWWLKSFQHTRVWCSAPPRRTVRTLQAWSANTWNSKPACSLMWLYCDQFWLLRFRLFQGIPQAQGGRKIPPPQRPKGERERLHVSRAQEDDTIRPGLSSQRADLGGEEAGGGGLLWWGPLSPHMHLHLGCRD